jgi:hypothetical protein
MRLHVERISGDGPLAVLDGARKVLVRRSLLVPFEKRAIERVVRDVRDVAEPVQRFVFAQRATRSVSSASAARSA